MIPDDMSLQRNKAVLATSSWVMFRPIGERSAWARFMSRYPLITRDESVSTGPALIALMRMLSRPRSQESCLTSFSSAGLRRAHDVIARKHALLTPGMSS